MPIAYIQRTRERYAQYSPLKWVVNHDAPWTPLAKPLRDCRLALISSGGFYTPDQPPFVERDASYRLISKDTRDIERGAAVAAELRRLAVDAAFLVPV